MGYFFTDEEMARRAGVTKKKREELLEELTAKFESPDLCEICKENPVWLAGLCQECLEQRGE